ncbi:MAG: glycine/sarcosine/betaine reductase selenoprotein B family protein [Alphaproteobacteria bacterium]
MVKWSDLSEASRASSSTYDFVDFDDRPWVTPPPPGERRVAVVSSAGIHAAGDKPFAWNGHDWRSFPRAQRDFHLSHISVNFDRSGFMADRNLYLPFDRLDELVDEGSLGSIAPTHYSFMGASGTPEHYIPHAETVAAAMKAEGVNTVVLAPV